MAPVSVTGIFMNKALFLAATAVVALTAGGAYAAVPAVSHKATGAAHVAPPKKAGVLFDDSADNSNIGIVSQVFESQYSQYDSQPATEFVVPKGKTWTITEVDVAGQYFNGSGPATSENVFFYTMKKGLPKKSMGEFDNVMGTDTAGSFAIKLKKGVVLKAGTYFLSVSANLAFSAGGEWGWDTTTSTTPVFSDPADWENPMNGFATGCTKYTVETTCIPDGQGADHVITLYGTSK